MIDFPPELVLKVKFKSLFTRGQLFHCENYDFQDGTSKNKFVLVLNGCNKDNMALFYLPTSQVDKRKSNSIFRDSLYVISPGSLAALNKETAIVIHDVHRTAYKYFERKFISGGDGRLEFRGTVPAPEMQNINNAILASTRLSLDIKRQILPEHLLAKSS